MSTAKFISLFSSVDPEKVLVATSGSSIHFRESFPTILNSDGGAKQSFKDESDINFILAKYQRTGVIDYVNNHQPEYGEAAAFDFQGALNMVKAAEDSFSALPSSMRKRFDNDPVQFMDFFNNEANRDEAIKLGLINPPVVPTGGVSSPVGDTGGDKPTGASVAP